MRAVWAAFVTASSLGATCTFASWTVAESGMLLTVCCRSCWAVRSSSILTAFTVAAAATVALEDRLRHQASHDALTALPNRSLLEERLATLEGATHALLLPSGLAAIALVDFALLKQGDEVLLPDNVYGPSRELARHELAQFGIAHRFYDPWTPRGWAPPSARAPAWSGSRRPAR